MINSQISHIRSFFFFTSITVCLSPETWSYFDFWFSFSLVTRSAYSIQLGRGEREGGRERGERNMLSLFNRAGRESHWFDIKKFKNHGFGLSCALDAPKCCVTERHASVLTGLVFDGFLF